MTPSSSIAADPKRNRFFAIYLSSLAVLGLGLIWAGATLGWGGWAYGLGGFLLVAGAGGGISMLVTGGAGKVSCPRCGHASEVLHISQERVLECAGCGEWLEGAREMSVVPPDRVAEKPCFTCPLPEGQLRWVRQEGALLCPTCGARAERMKTIEGASAVGTAASLVSPVSVQRVTEVDVPVCPEHEDGIWLLVLPDGKKLAFRSIYYMRLFRQLNGV